MKKYGVSALVAVLVCGLPAWGADSDQPQLQYEVETVLDGLRYPWSLAQLPDQSLLITEKPGHLLWVSADFANRQRVAGVPRPAWVGQGGLLDVRPHPSFGIDDNAWIYLSDSVPCATGFTTRLSRYQLRNGQLENGEVLFEAAPCGGLTWHFAGRIAFDSSGHVYLSVGDRGERERAQDLGTHYGKIIRLHADGTVPRDNPFVGVSGALPEIYSYGHRNPQGMVRHPVWDELWLHEHGPKGGDELNRVLPGRNYGWPKVTHGREYTGGIISEHTSAPGMEDPVLDWTPSIAPSGLAVYTGKPFEPWSGEFLVGALKSRQVLRVRVDKDGTVRQQVLPAPWDARIRDVRVLADGLIYVLTDAEAGRLLRLVPKPYN